MGVRPSRGVFPSSWWSQAVASASLATWVLSGGSRAEVRARRDVQHHLCGGGRHGLCCSPMRCVPSTSCFFYTTEAHTQDFVLDSLFLFCEYEHGRTRAVKLRVRCVPAGGLQVERGTDWVFFFQGVFPSSWWSRAFASASLTASVSLWGVLV